MEQHNHSIGVMFLINLNLIFADLKDLVSSTNSFSQVFSCLNARLSSSVRLMRLSLTVYVQDTEPNLAP